MKLAYALLNKIGSHKEGTSIMTGDRVSTCRRIIVELLCCSLISNRCLMNTNGALHLGRTKCLVVIAANDTYNMLLNPKCQ